MRGSLAQHRGEVVVEMLWDISKAFDRVRRSDLLKKAVDLGFPLSILRLSILSYTWPRRLVYGSLVSREITPTRGIGPGSAFATYELATLVVESLRLLQTKHPQVSLGLHVDDLLPQSITQSPSDAINVTYDFALTAIDEFETKLDLPFDQDKAQLLCTNKGVTKALSSLLGEKWANTSLPPGNSVLTIHLP